MLLCAKFVVVSIALVRNFLTRLIICFYTPQCQEWMRFIFPSAKIALHFLILDHFFNLVPFNLSWVSRFVDLCYVRFPCFPRVEVCKLLQLISNLTFYNMTEPSIKFYYQDYCENGISDFIHPYFSKTSFPCWSPCFTLYSTCTIFGALRGALCPNQYTVS